MCNKSLKKMKKVYILTVATHYDAMLVSLEDSITRISAHTSKNFSFVYEKLGFGKKWNGFVDKPYYLLERISSLNSEDIILFVDAYDVVFDPATTLEEIVNDFLNKQVDVFFSVSDLSNSDFICKYVYKKILVGLDMYSNSIGVNAGTFIGYKWAIEKILEMSFPISLKFNDDERSLNMLFNDKTVSNQDRANAKITLNTENNNVITIGLDIEKQLFDVVITTQNTLQNLLNFLFEWKIDGSYPRRSKIYHFVGSTDFREFCIANGIVPGRVKNDTVSRIYHISQFFGEEVAIFAYLFSLFLLVKFFFYSK